MHSLSHTHSQKSENVTSMRLPSTNLIASIVVECCAQPSKRNNTLKHLVSIGLAVLHIYQSHSTAFAHTYISSTMVLTQAQSHQAPQTKCICASNCPILCGYVGRQTHSHCQHLDRRDTCILFRAHTVDFGMRSLLIIKFAFLNTYCVHQCMCGRQAMWVAGARFIALAGARSSVNNACLRVYKIHMGTQIHTHITNPFIR